MLYEDGARLSTPARLCIERNAMGLGTNAEIMSPYESRSGATTDRPSWAVPHAATSVWGSGFSIRPVCLSLPPPSFLRDDGGPVVRPPVRPRLRDLQCALPVDPRGRHPEANPVRVDSIGPRAVEGNSRGSDARRLAHDRAQWPGHDGRRRGAHLGRRVPDWRRLWTSPSRLIRSDARGPPTLRVPHAVPRPARLPLGRGPAVGAFVPVTKDRSAFRFLR